MLRTACSLVFVCALAYAAPAAAQDGVSPASSVSPPTPRVAPDASTPADAGLATRDSGLVTDSRLATRDSGLVATRDSGLATDSRLATRDSGLATDSRLATRDSGLVTDSRLATRDSRLHRPAALVPLYASFATLQALDYVSTTRALSSGAGSEANPVMRSIVGNRAAFIAVKAGATAGVIVAGEKIWKKNRVAAVIFVAAMNGAMSAIVARNYAVP